MRIPSIFAVVLNCGKGAVVVKSGVDGGMEQPMLKGQARSQGVVAMAPGPLADRVDILIDLVQSQKAQGVVSLSQAHDRDELVAHLGRRQEYGVLVMLLSHDLAKWLPDAAEFNDLKWLLAALLDLKDQVKDQRANLVLQTSDGPLIKASGAYLKLLWHEALQAAASAWLRCLSGPGGEHRVWELPPVLQDRDLALAIWGLLAAHPGHLALILEDMPPGLQQTCLTTQELLQFLQKGLGAARFCHDTIKGAMVKIKE